jgi:general stress protein 26
MNNVTQQEENGSVQNLQGETAVKKVKTLADQAMICFFCTETPEGKFKGARPMSILKVDEHGVLWFVSPKDSVKNAEVAAEASVKLYFHGSAHSDLMYLLAKAYIHEDRNKIKEIWNPLLKTWFTEGEDDPRISIIRVEPDEGYYWDSKNGNFVATLKMFAGAISGKTMDDSVEGTLDLS